MGHVKDKWKPIMIDRHIPIPEAAKMNRGYASKYRWRDCQSVGDSFLTQELDINKVMAAMRKFCQRNPGYKFHAEVGKNKKIRVWRTQ